ncbi:retrotransposon polyprotein [Hirsutella rhossiliensis]|uniref:Retrotransposon polyprotein n=1 Tax=Hirsutella rhossiliensis TaxID=111463 RepID=A0A9P8MVQ9_9HYPO|nr:retrotransposon polyprotein [Hirsutella rhossiliensis]KAH0962155.1 retrotransposon polyprotein [Hirsutella rhossiliensis]
MIQALESAYGNPNELSEALDRLQRLQFTVNGKTDIVDFLAEFDYLTATGRVPEDQMKHTLWQHIPANLDNSLLTKTRDESVTYEVFYCSDYRQDSEQDRLDPITSRDAGRALTDDEKRSAAQRLGAQIKELPSRIPLQDFRGKPAGYIQKQLVATFVIDGRSFANETFDIAECGHDIFIDDLPALAKFSRRSSSRQAPLSGRIDPKIQADAERRNRLLEKEEKRYRILHKNWGRSDQTPPASVPTRYRLRLRRFSPSLRLPRTQRFTKIDVIQAFHRLLLPFGLKVGPAWFQQFINAQLHDLLDRFNVTKVDYLGVLLEAGVGLSVDPRKVRSIQDWKFEDLRDRTAIRSFVGLCNFIRVFCYHASGVAEPLNRLLKKDVAFVMGPEQREAFDQLKRLAIEAPVLAFFRPELPTRLETDASRNATAGVLWQEQPDQTWKPVGFFSKTMTPAERAYPIQDRELLAVVQSLEHFYPELLGQKFDVITDHEALVHFSTKRLLSVRQIRWSDFLAQFDIRFLYRPGRLNVVADALSRKTAELPTVKAREAEERTVTLILRKG